MNNEIKVSLTIVIPGRQLVSSQVCEENPKKYTEHNQITVEDRRTHKKEVIHYFTRKCIPARQNIKITKESYEYMIDKMSCPNWERISVWKKKSIQERLESHLNRIKDNMRGISFSYEILED